MVGVKLGLMLEQHASGEGRIRVRGCLEGFAAADCGMIRKGDLLVRIDGRACGDMSVEDATRLIAQGEYGCSARASADFLGKPCGIG